MKNIFLVLLFALNIQYINARPITISFISIPNNSSEFYNVFKRQPSEAELANVIELRNKYKGMSNVYLLSEEADIDKIINKIIDEWTTIPSIGINIIGHNEKGNFFFPNGSSVKLEDIVPKLKGLTAYFLSCNAKSYIKNLAPAVDFKLTYTDALKISNDMDIIWSTCNGLKKPSEVATEMIEKLNRKYNTNYRLKFLGTTGALSGSFLLLREFDEPEVIQQTSSDTTKFRQ
jgi:hypothetical protein